MIISQKHKKIVYLVPKTGTKSVVSYFKNISKDLLYIADTHQYISDDPRTTDEITKSVVEFIGAEEIKTYQYYCFYRDPVDRAIAAFNHTKRNPFYKNSQPKHVYVSVKNFLNKVFELETGITLTDPEKNICLYERSLEHRDFFDGLSIKTFIEYYDQAKRNPVEFGLEVDVLVPNLSVFDKQELWFNVPNLTILNFHDFENELKWLLQEFGSDPEDFPDIPKVNTSPSLLNPTVYKSLLQKTAEQYSLDEIDFIKKYYKTDYDLYERQKRNINTAV